MNKYKITSPCTQDWNAMQRVDGGRFCTHCNKTVHDLTENKDFIPPSTNETFCGRIIDETSVITKKIRFSRLVFWQRMMKLSPILASLLLGKTAFGQSKEIVIKDTNKIDISSHEQQLTGKIIISGKIRDKKTLEGIPFANVVMSIKDYQIAGAQTDMDGNFKISIDTSEINGKVFELKVSEVGYEILVLKDIPISKKDFVIDLKLNMCSAIVGEMTIITVTDGVPVYTKEPIPSGGVIKGDDLKHSPR